MIAALVAVVVVCGWLAVEVLLLARTCRQLQRSAPPRSPIDAPTIEERSEALEQWRMRLTQQDAPTPQGEEI